MYWDSHYPTPTKQTAVRSVNDGVHFKGCYVALDDFDHANAIAEEQALVP
jgi:hypothetical protein